MGAHSQQNYIQQLDFEFGANDSFRINNQKLNVNILKTIGIRSSYCNYLRRCRKVDVFKNIEKG